MGALTKLLNVGVVALAIVSVIYAGKLNSKRAELVGRGDKMATTINATGTALAAEFKTDTKAVAAADLGKLKYATIATVLGNVKKQADEVIAKKQGLDTTIVGLEETVTKKDGEITTLNGKVASAKQAEQVAKDEKSVAVKAQKKAEGALSSVENARDEAKASLATANSKNTELSKDNEAKNAEIATLKSDVETKLAKLAEYEKVLFAGTDQATGSEEPINLELFQPGEARTLGLVEGQITTVDTNLGYIAINVGSETEVIQAIGSKESPVKCGLTKGLTMTVARDGLYVTDLKLVTVGKTESIANISTDREKSVQVGDIIFFDRGALNKIEAQNKLTSN